MINGSIKNSKSAIRFLVYEGLRIQYSVNTLKLPCAEADCKLQGTEITKFSMLERWIYFFPPLSKDCQVI